MGHEEELQALSFIVILHHSCKLQDLKDNSDLGLITANKLFLIN